MEFIKKGKYKYIIKGTEECRYCNGTGLYIGMAEKCGAAVVCSGCNGSGLVKIEESFKEFKERKRRKGVKRVYRTAGGYGITAEDIKTEDGIMHKFSEYGCSYEDWLNGVKPKPIISLHCPYQHTSQGLQTKDKNNLYKNRCSKNLGYGFIDDCKLRKDMSKCWEIYNQKIERKQR
jgi:hypothetical protein